MRKIGKKIMAFFVATIIAASTILVGGTSVAAKSGVYITRTNQTYNFGGYDVRRNLLYGDDNNAYYCINPRTTIGNDNYGQIADLSEYSTTRDKSERSDISNDLIKYIVYWGSIYGGTCPDEIVYWGITLAVHKYPIASWMTNVTRVSYNANGNNPINEIVASSGSDQSKIITIAEFLTSKAEISMRSGFVLSGPCDVNLTKISGDYIENNYYVNAKYFVSGTFTDFSIVNNNSSENIIIEKAGNIITVKTSTNNTSGSVDFGVSAYRMGYAVNWYQSQNYASTYQDIVRMVRADTYDSKTVTLTLSDNAGSIEIYKKDATTNIPLQNVEFKIKNTTTNDYWIKSTNASGYVKFSGLPYGIYSIEETKAAPGYVNESNSWENINITAQNKNLSFIVYNGAQSRSIGITKTDIETNIAQGEATLAGATYDIYDSTKTTILDTVSFDGNVGTSSYLPIGTYYLKEKIAPAGYNLDDRFIEVTLAAGNAAFLYLPAKQVTVSDSVIKGQIKINKSYDRDLNETKNTGGKMSGAKFNIVSAVTNEVVDVITTDDNGYAISKLLPFGEYKVSEVECKEGYNKVDSFNVFIGENNKVYTYNLTDTAILKSIKIIKQDADGNVIEKAGTTFNLYSAATNSKISINGISDFVTDDSGVVVISSQLTIGEYYAVETVAPLGYQLNNEKKYFVIDIDSNTQEIIVKDNVITGNIKIVKTDNQNNPLSDCSFSIKNSDNVEVKKDKTDNDGILNISGLPYGVYTCKETECKEGYVLNENIFTVNIDLQGETEVVNVINKKIVGKIEIVKTDEDGGLLSDCKIQLKDFWGNVVGEKTTDASGKVVFENLPYGIYYYFEIEAPVGYVLDSTEHKVKIITDDVKVSNTLINKEIVGNVEITKKDEFGNLLAECEINLFNDDNNVIDCKKTDNNGMVRFSGLKYGKYYYAEKTAPTGYVLDSSKHEINIYENEKTVFTVLNNTKIKGTINITKTNTDSVPLNGCVIGLYNNNGDLVSEKETGSNGVVSFDSIEYGKYYCSEIKAPMGYNLNTEKINFEILTNGEVLSGTIIDSIITGNLQITKKDNNNNYLKNCVIAIYDNNDVLIKKGATDENGVILFNDLSYGEYYYCEIEAPAGYIINTEKHKFNILENQVTIKEVLINEKSENNVQSTSPKTGDNSVMYYYLMFITSTTFVVLKIFRKKIYKK